MTIRRMFLKRTTAALTTGIVASQVWTPGAQRIGQDTVTWNRRNQRFVIRDATTNAVVATSDDGVHWVMQ